MRPALCLAIALVLAPAPVLADPHPICPAPLASMKRADSLASCSAGSRSRGRLLRGAHLPDTGCGFRRIFPNRDLAYGTDALVTALARAADEIRRGAFSHRMFDGLNPPLGVGNLTGSPGHAREEDPYLGKRFSLSHTSGRAADFAYFILDRAGRAVIAHETAIGYRADGWNVSGWRRLYLDARRGAPPGACNRGLTFQGVTEWKCFVPGGTYRLDDERNWALVRALLTDPLIGVIDPRTKRVRPKDRGIRRILVSNGIRERLLNEARRKGEPERFVVLAAAILRQPGNAPPHDDHLHVDLNCAYEDIRRCGCRNEGVPERPFVGEILDGVSRRKGA